MPPPRSPAATMRPATSSTRSNGASSYGPSHVGVSRTYSTSVSERRVPLMNVIAERSGHPRAAGRVPRRRGRSGRSSASPRRSGPRARARPSSRSVPLQAMMPRSKSRSSRGSSSPARAPGCRPPGDTKPVLVERVRVLPAAREHGHLDDLRQMACEEAADRPGADDADALDHADLLRSAGARRRRVGSRNSRPRVRPLGQEHEHDGHEDRDADEATSAPQRLSDEVVDETDLSALGPEQERVERAHGERTDDRAPQASDAADDEHRESEEREIEVDVACLERPGQMHEKAAGEPRQAPPRARTPRAARGECRSRLRARPPNPRALRAASCRSGFAGTRRPPSRPRSRRASPAGGRSSREPSSA